MNPDQQRKNQLLGILNHESAKSIVYEDPRKDNDDDESSSSTSIIKNKKKSKKRHIKSSRSKKPSCSSRVMDDDDEDEDTSGIDIGSNTSDSDDYNNSSDSETEEVKNMYKKLGLSTTKTKYRTKIDIKRDENLEIIDTPPDMTEHEFNTFTQIIVPSIVNPNIKQKTKQTVDLTFLGNKSHDDDLEDEDYAKLSSIIQDMKTKFNIQKTTRQIEKIRQDAMIESKRASRNFNKYDTYFDLKYFDSLRLFSTEWKSAILNDQNVEIPFIYLQSLQTGGVGAIPYAFYSCVEMLEAYGMTIEILEETVFSCTYRAFFSGRVKQQIKTDDITAIREKAAEYNKNKIKEKKEGGASAGSYSVPPNSYKDMLYQASDASGVDRLKEAHKNATKHERPIRLFDTRRIITEEEKIEKKRQNVMSMHLNLNLQMIDDEDEQEEVEYMSHSDDDKKRDAWLYEDELQVKKKSSNYDHLLNGFTREMVNSINSSSKFMNKKSLDSIARNQTELSAWIENHLCIDICIFPGMNSVNDTDKKIERQLLFMFTLKTQNPYTFLLMNLPEVEKKSMQNQDILSS